MAVYKTTGTSALKNDYPFAVISGRGITRSIKNEPLHNFMAFSDARQFDYKDNINLSDDALKKVGFGIFLTSLLTIGLMALLTFL